MSRKNGTIAAIILAAGASTRMGTPKQLLRGVQGRSLLRSTIETAIATDCSPVFVVLGAYIEQIRNEVEDLPVRVVENRKWQRGMGASISIGIQALLQYSPEVEAAIVLLCDQPFVSPQLIQALKSIYGSTHQPIVASSYQNTIGVPALFNFTLFPELVELNRREGAKTVIQRHINSVTTINFPEGAIDVDTPQDYQQYVFHLWES